MQQKCKSLGILRHNVNFHWQHQVKYNDFHHFYILWKRYFNEINWINRIQQDNLYIAGPPLSPLQTPTRLSSKLLSAQNMESMRRSGMKAWTLSWSCRLTVELNLSLHSSLLLIETSICVKSFPLSPLLSTPQPWTVIPKPTLDLGELKTFEGRQMELISTENSKG